MHAKQIVTFSKCRLITGLLLILVATGALGRLTEAPKNNFVLKGATAEFTCCSDIQAPFFWKVKSTGSQSIKDIYDIGGLVNGFPKTGRFNVSDGSSSGCYRLIITDVKMEDAGTYFCVDKEGLGQQLGWELVILEFFNCRETNRKAEYMGENNFGLPQDVISTVCISKYFGNIPPKQICEWSSGAQVHDNNQHVTEANLTITLNIHIPAKKEFNGDQLSCYVKNDGESSENQTPAAWKSSHLIINYASFHQKGIQQCSVDELSLDCHPPCNYKNIQFSNGSSYCEIAYPNKTHQKFYVLQKYDILPGTTNNHSSTHNPHESQTPSSGTLTVILTSVITGLIGIGVGLTLFLIYYCYKRRRSPVRHTEAIAMEERRPAENPRGAPINVGDGGVLMINTASNGNQLSVQHNVIGAENSNKNPETAPFLSGGNKTARPCFVINMGDGINTTFTDVHDIQQSSVNMKQENKPLLKEVDTKKMNRMSATTNSDSETLTIRGFAVLGKDVFVSYRKSSEVMVYSSDAFQYQRNFELKELNLTDMTACSECNCLYVSAVKVAGSECEIFKVSPQGSLITRWKTGTNVGLLSITYDSNVLMAAHLNRKLIEYKPDGSLLNELQLPFDSFLNYALKVNRDHYLVSHGYDKDRFHGVSEVDANGKILRSFGGARGPKTKQLNTPVHLAIHYQSIWVADSKNGRVVVLSPTLKYQSTLLSNEDELHCPTRICFDQVRRRLLISDIKNKTLFLRGFDIT